MGTVYYRQRRVERESVETSKKKGLHSPADGLKPLEIDKKTGKVIRPKRYGAPTHDYSGIFGWNWNDK